MLIVVEDDLAYGIGKVMITIVDGLDIEIMGVYDGFKKGKLVFVHNPYQPALIRLRELKIAFQQFKYFFYPFHIMSYRSFVVGLVELETVADRSAALLYIGIVKAYVRYLVKHIFSGIDYFLLERAGGVRSVFVCGYFQFLSELLQSDPTATGL
jgi:hypothetical protein